LNKLIYSLTILIIFSFFASCENDLEAIKKVINKEEVAIERAQDVEMLYSDSAALRVKVTGPVLLRHLDKINTREEFPAGIMVEFYDPLQRVQSKLTSKYAIRYEKKKQVIVRDSVVWLSRKNERLETEELIWDEKTKKVYTDRFVVIKKPEETVRGYGFEANQEFTRWKIIAPVGEFNVDNLKETVE